MRKEGAPNPLNPYLQIRALKFRSQFILRSDSMKRLMLALAVLALCGLTAVALAGDWHTGVNLVCSDCHIMHYSQAHGYTPTAKDFQDMEHLRQRFGVEIPPQLRPGAES